MAKGVFWGVIGVFGEGVWVFCSVMRFVLLIKRINLLARQHSFLFASDVMRWVFYCNSPQLRVLNNSWMCSFSGNPALSSVCQHNPKWGCSKSCVSLVSSFSSHSIAPFCQEPSLSGLSHLLTNWQGCRLRCNASYRGGRHIEQVQNTI